MIHTINLRQKDEWNFYVQQCIDYDFYHTWHYHSLDDSGEAVLFVFEKEDSFIAFPMIKRSIPDSEMVDITSVYGYPGPIANRPFDDLDETFLDGFKAAFLNFLKAEGCVSVFSRLNPFINSKVLMDKFGGVHPNGKTVAIDLSLPLETQRSTYKKSVRYFMKKAAKKGYVVKQAQSIDDVYLFTEMYHGNMGRVKATEGYYFDLPYFIEMVNSSDFDCRLYLVYDGERAISGSLATFTNGVVQIHLVATLPEYLVDSPSKFLVDEITLIARNEGLTYCHLGGGLGFKEDSLFEWKACFSDLFLNYASWRFIADQEAYNSLCLNQGLDLDNDIDFFPLYRMPALAASTNAEPC